MRTPGKILRQALVFMLALLPLLGGPAHAQMTPPAPREPPGFGIVVAGGDAGEGIELRRVGFSSRRLKDGERMGALTFQAEEHKGSLVPARLDSTLAADGVSVTYQSVFLELKNYSALWGPLLTFWGLRGGATRITGSVTPSGGSRYEFTRDQIAPLLLLALPLMLEHPGFILLGGLDGASAGIALDLVPRRVWLELQVGAAIAPGYHDALIVLEQSFVVTRALSLTVAF